MKLVNKYLGFLYNIDNDRYIHILACLILSFIFSVTSNMEFGIFFSIFISYTLTMFLGFIKELFDDFFDKKDILYDFIGTTIGNLLFLYSLL